LILIITGMTVSSHTLFLQVFPNTMTAWEKDVAAWVMALAWDATVLITTCNPTFVNKRVPWLMAIASGINMLFFLEAFDVSLTGLQIAQKWFIASLTSTLTYIYSELFYAKWVERNKTLQMPTRLKETEAKVQQLEATLQQRDASLKEIRALAEQDGRELKELRAFRKKVEQELTCPHCKTAQASHNSLRSHQGHCPKNPRNNTKTLTQA
jgi:hypothetical protein